MEVFWMQVTGSRVKWEVISDRNSWIWREKLHASPEYGTGNRVRLKYISEKNEAWDHIWIKIWKLVGQIAFKLEPWNEGWTLAGSYAEKRRLQEDWAWAEAWRMEDAGSSYQTRWLCLQFLQISLREKQRLTQLEFGWVGQNLGLWVPCSPHV